MTVTIVVGGFRGGEGKGKLVAYLALADQPVLAARLRGPEQVLEWGGQQQTVACLPSALIHPDTRLLVGPGEGVDVGLLLSEIERLGVADRVGVDPRGRIEGHAVRAGDVPELSRFLTDVPLELHTAARRGQTVLIEGAHGFGVSALYGQAEAGTEGDTTAQACCVRVGLGPTQVTDVVVVFPALSDAPTGPASETNGVRDEARIDNFDLDLARQAVIVNGATAIALTGLDRRSARAQGVQRRPQLPTEARQFIDSLEAMLGLPVALVSTGPAIEHVIDLR
ncbi:MAG: adenylosuccinate synthetase [Anaerolineae bacterium]|nr:adenylosuccinate synthetase [Anaerolineae bacterium]